MERAGRLVVPQVAAYSRDVLVPFYRLTGRRRPMPPDVVLRNAASAYARLGVRYVGRVPGISPHLYSVVAAGSVVLVVGAIFLAAHV